ncbi:MAG: ABC transporter permease [Candidatus Bathyarchaeia archaeon]
MGLRAYIAKRIIYSFVLILLVATLNFIIFMVMPGDPVGMYISGLKGLGEKELKELAQRLRELYGIGDPLPIQYMKYLRNVFSWQFGLSLKNRTPVADELMYRLPWTLILMGGSTALSIVIGTILGVYVAHKRGGKFDSAMVLSSLMFYSLPTFWMGMIFILVFCLRLGWFPSAHAYPVEWTYGRGVNFPQPLSLNINSTSQTLNMVLSFDFSKGLTLITGYLRHAFLPVFTLTIFQYGGYLLLTRATMLEALTEDYIVTARAKGVKERTVLFRHALKNASLPLITNAALAFGFMLSGAIITETVYSWPGLGGWIWNAIITYDYTVLQAIFFIIAVCVIVANFIADLLYGVIDPRIKYG